jgi:hypothetical protein
MKTFSNFVNAFGFLFSAYSLFLCYYLPSDYDYFFDLIGIWFLFIVYLIFFRSRFYQSEKKYFIQMVIYATFFIIFFLIYFSDQFGEYFPFNQKHFFPPVKLKCKAVLIEKKNSNVFIRYSATINCDPEKVEVTLEDSSILKIKYSSFEFDFNFPHGHFEGFYIQEAKIILPYLYYKFDSRSKMFYSTSSICRRYNLETGEDEILWNCF